MNKEDIWICRIDVPVSGPETGDVWENFEHAETVQDLKRWNVHVPLWAPVNISRETTGANKVLELRDEDPYEYAKVERVFPVSKKTEISFRVNLVANLQGHAFEAEVQDAHGLRPIRLRFDQDWLMFDLNQVELDPVPFSVKRWATIKLLIDTDKQSYDAYFDGKLVRKEIDLAEKVTSVERIIFRTGPYRGYTDALLAKEGPPAVGGISSEDLPGAGEKVPANIYWLDDIIIKKIR